MSDTAAVMKEMKITANFSESLLLKLEIRF
jgi:hypothetical protein